MLASCLSEGAGTNILLDARASRSNRFRELSCFTCNVEAMFETNPSTLSLLGIADIRLGLQCLLSFVVSFLLQGYNVPFVALHLVRMICPLFQYAVATDAKILHWNNVPAAIFNFVDI